MVVGEMVQETDLVVIGGGPGGYVAAIRAGELGIKTVLIDSRAKLGGVCLNEGCIPSKALLHAAEVVNTAKHAKSIGIEFQAPKVDVDQLRTWKNSVIDKLSQGIAGMCKGAKVEVLTGTAQFEDSRSLRVDCPGESAVRVKFKHAIIATGSRITRVPKIFKSEKDAQSKRVLDSQSALDLADVPKTLLVVGGGYIGLEMGTVYAALGSKVTVVEMLDGLLPGADRDLVKPLAARLQEDFEAIYLSTKVESIEETADGMNVKLTGKDVPSSLKFDKVLIAVGRQPNSDNIGLQNTKVEVNPHGFIIVDEHLRTSDKRIFAIGDVSGQPMLAHRASRQGVVVAEVIAGRPSAFDNRAIPAVIFTEPEIAWCGVTEGEAKAKNLKIQTARFPWSASGRAMSLNDTTGHTKIVFDPETTRVLGLAMVGPRAGELIAEGVLAVEAGLTLEDLVATIHAHPTLSETVMEAASQALSRLERQRASETEKEPTRKP